MRHKIAVISAFFLSGFWLTGLNAQESIPSTGGNALGSGGSVSYSVGQVMYITGTGTNGTAAQGVQQPFEISIVGIQEIAGITLQCTAFPNPVNSSLTLKVENYQSEDMGYQLSNMNGKLLEQKKVNSSETIIEMSKLVPAIYFLKIMQTDKEIITFKIIKN